MKTQDLDTYDQLLSDFQPDLRYIVRRYRKNFHALSEEEIVSEVNRRLILYKDKYILQDDACLHKEGFAKFAYSCAKNAVFWTAKGTSKKEINSNKLTSLYSFIEDRDSREGIDNYISSQIFNAAQEPSFLVDMCASNKINDIIKWITEYSDFLDERESVIFKQLILGKTHQEICKSVGVTRQMVSLIVINIFQKIKDNVKVKINTDNSLVKIKKGLKAVNHLFG